MAAIIIPQVQNLFHDSRLKHLFKFRFFNFFDSLDVNDEKIGKIKVK